MCNDVVDEHADDIGTDNSPLEILSPLGFVNWPENKKIWTKKVTLSDLTEILDVMALEGEIREAVSDFAVKEISANYDYEESAGLDEEELYARVYSFVEGFKAGSTAQEKTVPHQDLENGGTTRSDL
ncbi:MAG TPA: hypothetical protein VEH58_03465 [Dehalococcoidales bacterium]|nr:hypothetical protein [Dehalococcoidales bacterium]